MTIEQAVLAAANVTLVGIGIWKSCELIASGIVWVLSKTILK